MADDTSQPVDTESPAVDKDSIHAAMGDRVPMVKAVILGGDVPISNTISVDEATEQAFTRAGTLEPPYDPVTLTLLIEHSNSLRQNIDAYATNIDGFGWRFDPTLDLESDQVEDVVREAMIEERRRGLDLEARVNDAVQIAQDALVEVDARKQDAPTRADNDEEAPDDGEDGDGDEGSDDASADGQTSPAAPPGKLTPTDAEVKERLEIIQRTALRERRQVEQFFKFCCADQSFTELRRKTRLDHELLGNAYWEILRNTAGEIVQIVYIPGFTVRLMPADRVPIRVPMRVMTTAITYDVVSVARRFRRYVQVVENRSVWFKEFGDPRTISAFTGRIYINEAALHHSEGKDGKPVFSATEIVHWKVHSPRSAYGVPRWIGNLLSVLGSRQAEEINFLYFQNKSVPPLAILVSGGRLAKDSIDQIKNHIEHNIKGKNNWHKILLLEAAPATGGALTSSASGTARIEIKPLTTAIEKDALFQNYDIRNAEKVGQSFRIPKLLRGDIDDFPGRATAEAALGFAEMQVFAPEREQFDWHINRMILADMQICFWKFVSNTPKTRNAKEMTEILERLSKAGLITPKEARIPIGEILNRELEPIEQPWVEQPMEMTLKGIDQTGVGDDADDEQDDELEAELAEAADKADLSVSDLRAAGLLRPAQGGRGRRRRRGLFQLPPLIDQAKQLVALRNIYAVLESRAAERETADAIDAVADTRKRAESTPSSDAPPPEEMIVPYDVHQGKWVEPKDDDSDDGESE